MRVEIDMHKSPVSTHTYWHTNCYAHFFRWICTECATQFYVVHETFFFAVKWHHSIGSLVWVVEATHAQKKSI